MTIWIANFNFQLLPFTNVSSVKKIHAIVLTIIFELLFTFAHINSGQFYAPEWLI